jgi:hypothetical protein
MATEYITLIQYQTSYDLKLLLKILPYHPPEECRNNHLRDPILHLREGQAQNVFILIYKALRKTAPTLLDQFQEVSLIWI